MPDDERESGASLTSADSTTSVIRVLMLGRAYCPACRKVRRYVKDAAIDGPLVCPTCNGDTEWATGDEP